MRWWWLSWAYYLTTNGGKMNWSPDDPALKSDKAPHESRAVLRMQRAGHSGPRIIQILKMPAARVQHQMRLGLDEENTAHMLGLPIHDAAIRRGDGPWAGGIAPYGRV